MLWMERKFVEIRVREVERTCLLRVHHHPRLGSEDDDFTPSLSIGPFREKILS